MLLEVLGTAQQISLKSSSPADDLNFEALLYVVQTLSKELEFFVSAFRTCFYCPPLSLTVFQDKSLQALSESNIIKI